MKIVILENVRWQIRSWNWFFYFGFFMDLYRNYKRVNITWKNTVYAFHKCTHLTKNDKN